MKHISFLKTVAFTLVGFLFLLSACDRSIDETPIPEDESPAIALVTPTTNNFLDTIGSTVNATFRLDDNEQLRVFRVVREVYNDRDSLIGTPFIVQEDTISGQHIFHYFDYIVPTFNYYYTIKLTCYVIDSKGAYSSTVMYISLVPPPSAPPVYLLESYTGDKLYSAQAMNNKHFFDFAARAYINNTLDRDVEETTSGPGGFVRELISPNNQIAGSPDSVFVMTDATRFNFQNASYRTIWEAFYSFPQPTNQTPPLNISDIVIVRLTSKPHFAVMRITDINDAPGDLNDYIEFDYKVSY